MRGSLPRWEAFTIGNFVVYDGVKGNQSPHLQACHGVERITLDGSHIAQLSVYCW